MGPFQINIFDGIKRFFTQKTTLSRLMLVNIAIWVICLFISVFTWLFNAEGIFFMTKWFAVPADLSVLALKPWTVFTYMFLQENFWHLFFNMLMLYFGGIIFLQFLSQRQLLWTYIVGGLVGALFFILSYNVFPVFEMTKNAAVALGSSASVLSILVTAATYRPEYGVNLLFFGQVKMEWIAIIFVIIDFLSINRGNPGGHIAHLGGAFWGFLYALLLTKNNDLYRTFKTSRHQKKYKFKNYNKDSYNKRPKTDEQYNYEHAEEQIEIDRILEKISKNGYSSLTEKEKEFLFKQSKK